MRNGWRQFRLGDLGRTYTGLTGKSKADFGESGCPFIPYLNIFENSRVDLGRLSHVRVSDGEHQNRVRYGDIFFTSSSETAKEVGTASVLLDEITRPIYLNSFCFGFRLHSFHNFLPEYARYYLRGEAMRRELYRAAQGATRYNLSKRHLLDVSIQLPPLDQQRKIASLISTWEAAMTALHAKQDALARQKAGLMRSLLSGELQAL